MPQNDFISWVAEDGTLHEECKMIFSVGDTVLGEILFDPGHAPQLQWRRCGICYFCRHCGSVWGKLTIVNSRGVTMPFDAWEVSCKDHPDQWQMPGSFLAKGLAPLIKYLPPTVAKWELALLGEAMGS